MEKAQHQGAILPSPWPPVPYGRGLNILMFGLEIFPSEQQTPEALGALQKAETEK
jgi:hypothetical protein